VRWDGQRLDAAQDEAPPTLPGMPELAGRIRVVRPPEFAGVTFHEVAARSALNKVPAASQVPFQWTVNPFRGCTHGCVYCFARGTHSYLEFDTGHDFDTQIVVKVNVAEVLRREVFRPSWGREHVALGTNTDPYQRAEGRYRLMPGVVAALADSGTPFSILSKGTVLSRDLPLLRALDDKPGMAVSLALLDSELQATLEPGTPTPKARLELIRRIVDAGLPCSVLIAPILPYLTDTTEQLSALVLQLVHMGVSGVTGIVLHLRPGAREWFLQWLSTCRPDLVPAYQRLYRRGSYADKSYRGEIHHRLASAKSAAGLRAERVWSYREVPTTAPTTPTSAVEPEQLTLM
jgi:DNA repair photolyase